MVEFIINEYSRLISDYAMVALAIVAVLFVIAMVKKAFKLIVLVIMVAALMGFLGISSSNIEEAKEKYSVRINDAVMQIGSSDEFRFDLRDISKLECSPIDGSSGYKVEVYKGNDLVAYQMSKEVWGLLKYNAGKHGVEIVEQQD